MIFSVFQKNWVFGYSWSPLLWYRCYYPHRSRDALSPVCGIFPKEFTHIIKNYNFRLQGLQIEMFQQRYLKGKCEKPYLEAELIPKTCKNWKMSSKTIFLSGLVTKLENLFVFGNILWKISSYWWFQKKGLTDLTSAQTSKVCYT